MDLNLLILFINSGLVSGNCTPCNIPYPLELNVKGFERMFQD